MNQLRSVLYMPASNRRAMDKARDLPCDALIFDLEDSVAVEAKELARKQVLEQLQSGGYGRRQLVVRVNGATTPWAEADLLALARAGVDTVCLPKVESLEQLHHCRELLRSGLSGGDEPKLWAMIETPGGVYNAEQICSAGKPLQALVMGTTDLAHELRVPVRPDRLGLLYALSKCVNAARMAKIVVLDSVFLNIEDSPAFRFDCEFGKALGFDGKTLVHPSQIADANEVFGLGQAQVEWARRIMAAWQAAQAEGKGVTVVDGKLVETMHIDEAERILALAPQL